ncbi:MAG: hypothetical protein R3A51_13880 [Nannocystaceae bacterium]
MIASIPALTLAATLAGAPPPTLTVDWQLADGCPSRQVLDEQLARLVTPPPGPARATIAITGDAAGFSLALTIDHDGRSLDRQLEHGSCEALARAAILIVAVHLSPLEVASELDAALGAPVEVDAPAPDDAAAPRPSAALGGAVVEAPAVPPPPVATASPEVEDSARRSHRVDRARSADPPAIPLRGAVRPQAAFGLGALPSYDAGGGLAVALMGRRARLELVGAAWATGALEHPSLPITGNITFWSGGVRGGPYVRVGAIELHLQALLDVGAVVASAAPLTDARPRTSPWVALGLAAGVAWPVHRLIALWIGAEGFGVLARPRFTIRSAGDFYVARAAGFRGVFGVELRFP